MDRKARERWVRMRASELYAVADPACDCSYQDGARFHDRDCALKAWFKRCMDEAAREFEAGAAMPAAA